MKAKIWVGIALIIAIIFVVSVFAVGLPDYLNGKVQVQNSVIITDKKSVTGGIPLALTDVSNSTNSSQSATATTNTAASQSSSQSSANTASAPQPQAVQSPPPMRTVRVTRAS